MVRDAPGSSGIFAEIVRRLEETGEIRRSAEVIRKALPDAILHPLPGYRHGDFSINHAGAYAEEVQRILAAKALV